MNSPRALPPKSVAEQAFPELAPPEEASGEARVYVRQARNALHLVSSEPRPRLGALRSTLLSFRNMHLHGELLANYLEARKHVFIDRLHWSVAQSDGMEFDQYDNPFCRWLVIHEYGEVLGGIRFSPTVERVGCYSYMLRDAQRGLLPDIPNDVLFFDAPVSASIWEASRFFISDAVRAQRRLQIQTLLVEKLNATGFELGASHVIGIVPAVWGRWVRRIDIDLGAVPVGPRFSIDGTVSQAVLFKTAARSERAA